MAERFNLDIGPDPAAVAFLEGKGVQRSWRWPSLWREQHATAFTLAGVWRLDVIAAAQELTTKAVAAGETYEMFQAGFADRMAKLGFAGRQLVTEFAEGPRVVNLTASWRMKVIYDTNVRQAYAAAEWAAIEETKADFPALQYQGVRDERTRASHARWFGVVRPVDDPFWRTHYPPNDWYCRCFVIQISVDELASGAVKMTSEEDLAATGFDPNPETWPEWHHEKTGRTARTPPGVAPGFASNAGLARRQNLGDLLGRRVETLPANLGRAASADLVALPGFRDFVDDARGTGLRRAMSKAREKARLISEGRPAAAADAAAEAIARQADPWPAVTWPLAVAPADEVFRGRPLVVVSAEGAGHSAEHHKTMTDDWSGVLQLLSAAEIWDEGGGHLAVLGQLEDGAGDQRTWLLSLKPLDGAYRVKSFFQASPRKRAALARRARLVRAAGPPEQQ